MSVTANIINGLTIADWLLDYAAEAKDDHDFPKMGILQDLSAYIVELEAEVARLSVIISTMQKPHNERT